MDRPSAFIRQDCDYAFRALLHLASEKGRRITCSELAASCDIPRSFAYKILKKLSTSGILISHAGRNGGFKLGANPRRISLIDVIMAVQGPVCVSRCVLEPGVCSRYERCSLSNKWTVIQNRLVASLRRSTLKDLLDGVGVGAGLTRKRAATRKSRCHSTARMERRRPHVAT